MKTVILFMISNIAEGLYLGYSWSLLALKFPIGLLPTGVKVSGGEGGIRTLGALLELGALAKLCFRPLSHLTIGRKLRLC